MIILDRVKKVIELIQSETDIEEIDFDDKELGIHIRVKRNLSSQCSRPDITQGKCTGCTVTDVKPDCSVHNHMLSGG